MKKRQFLKLLCLASLMPKQKREIDAKIPHDKMDGPYLDAVMRELGPRPKCFWRRLHPNRESDLLCARGGVWIWNGPAPAPKSFTDRSGRFLNGPKEFSFYEPA